jgi:hypothetical protein
MHFILPDQTSYTHNGIQQGDDYRSVFRLLKIMAQILFLG